MKKLWPSILIISGLGADGWIDPPPDYHIQEEGQVAIVKYYNSREDLIIDAKFKGNTKDFTWIIPTPALPAIDSVSPQLFYALQDYTQPIYKKRGLGCEGILGGESGYKDDEGDEEGVREVGEGVIGDFAYKIIEAQSAEALSQYLTQNGYAYPSDAPSILDSYIAKGWQYFWVARTDTAKTGYSGEVGVRLSFDAQAPVYPLRITSLGSDSIDLILYVLADHRMILNGAQLKFAGWVSPESLPSYSDIIDRTCFLTKLTRRFTAEDMEDITLLQAPDDKEYREVIFYSSWGEFLLIGALGIVLLIKAKKT